jgi:hypothetical protein
MICSRHIRDKKLLVVDHFDKTGCAAFAQSPLALLVARKQNGDLLMNS